MNFPRYIVLTGLLFCFAAASFAQKPTKEKQNTPAQVFTFVEQMPEFPGGNSNISAYLAKNIHYPDSARSSDIQGRVIIKFLVDEDGSIEDAFVLKGIGGGCDEEALRVIRAMPHWKPGMQNGKAVKVYFTIPITFHLEDDDADKIYTTVEQMPEFPGGQQGLNDYLSENLRYPEKAKKQKLQGTVIVKCVINSKGLAINEAIESGKFSPECNEEALRLVRLTPRWKPGMHDGAPVNVVYHIPVKFSLKKK